MTDVSEPPALYAQLLDPSREHDPNTEGHLLGGKGASLARLISAGYPVPQTGVVTTEAYRAVAGGNDLASKLRPLLNFESTTEGDIDALFEPLVLGEVVRNAIIQLAKDVGRGGLIAIRSSATVEDLHGSSFAGQYQSFLNISSDDAEEVIATIKRVWASLWHPAPTAYRRAFDTPEDDVAMAVVLMEMIPATTAGVVFTVDPGGAENSARVEAVDGLGEALVSGARTPAAWVLERGATDQSVPIAAQRALELSLDIERRYDQPQDVEWAAIDDEVSIVQARPITVLGMDDGFDSPVDDHELTTAGIIEMVPGVVGPLLWELNHFILGEAFRSFLDQLGILRGADVEDKHFVRRVRGRIAVDFDQLRDAASHVEGAADRLEQQYFGTGVEQNLEPESRRTFKSMVASARRDVRALATRREAISQADVVIAAAEVLSTRHPSPDELDLDRLSAYLMQLVDLGARSLAAELAVAATAAASFTHLEAILIRHLGEDEGRRAALEVTASMPRRATVLPGSSAAIFAGPTWDEIGTTPATINADPTLAQHRQDQLCERLQDLPGWNRKRMLTGQIIDIRIHLLRRAIDDVHEQTYRREATKAALLQIGGYVRRTHLTLGERLVAQDSLEAADDVFLLTTSEVQKALDGNPSHRNEVLRRRRNWLSRYEAEGILPSRFVGIPSREPSPLPEGDQLLGWASSPGRYQGRARVLTSPTQRLPRGDILVATTTDASWSPVFVRAGAVIVEQGGPLSHAAILARELGLPAVLNIDGATRVLDNAIVTVDGDLGTVVIEHKPAVVL